MEKAGNKDFLTTEKIKCENCNYCIENNGEKFCAYYNQYLDFCAIYQLCAFAEKRTVR